jgi:hypothetical protein
MNAATRVMTMSRMMVSQALTASGFNVPPGHG